MSSDSTIRTQQDGTSTDLFVGRKSEQDLYEKLLTRNTPWVLMITGLGGIGKSTLLHTLYANTPSEICVVTLDFAERLLRTDPSAFIGRLVTETIRCCSPQHDDESINNLQTYIQQLAALSAKRNQEISESNYVTADVYSNLNEFDEITSHEIYHQLRGLATEALYDQLEKLPLKQLVLLLDTCELLIEPEGWEIGQWVMDELIPELHTRLQQIDKKFSVVIASRIKMRLEVIDQQDQQHIILSMLEKEAVDYYLEQMGIRDLELRQRVYNITHGHALCVSIIGKLWQQQSLTVADLPTLEKFNEIEKFSEYALMRFTNDRILVHLKSPYRELTRYGVILRSFNLPILRAIFPDFLPESEAFDRFDRLIRYPYIESLGNHLYAFHELLREALSEELQTNVVENEKWKSYHRRAQNYFTEVSPRSPDRYFHAIACDEKFGMAEWQKAVHELENTPYARGALLQVTYDKTLKLTPESQAVRDYEQGRFLSSSAQWLEESGSKQQARARQKEALETLSNANSLFQKVGDNLGESETKEAINALQQRSALPRTTLKLYEQADQFLESSVVDKLPTSSEGDQTTEVANSSTRQQRPINNDHDQWHIYWQAQNQPWRTEPEIDVGRQVALTKCLNVPPQIEQGIYPFKSIELSRADIEWLLATHEKGRGPVDLSDESQQERRGLDLRGANLRGVDLSGLPLTCMLGGLRSDEWIFEKEHDETANSDRMYLSTVNLEGADLSRAHLERAILNHVNLERAILSEAHLSETNLSEARLIGADLKRAYLIETNLREAHLEGAYFSGAHMGKAYLSGAYLEGSYLNGANLGKATLTEAHLERSILQGVNLEEADLRNIHLESTDLGEASLGKANLFGAHLEGADLKAAHLEGADLRGAHLEGANLYEANLKGAFLGTENLLEVADYTIAHLEGANLSKADLQGANLAYARLEGVDLSHARLEGANLYRASLGGKCLPTLELERLRAWKGDFPGTLPPTDLRRAVFDSETNLEEVVLGNTNYGFVSIADVYWGEVNLAVVDWRQVDMLGDEREAHQEQNPNRNMKDKKYREAVRANRQLAVVLRNQGLNEEGSYFAYRAHALTREVLRREIEVWPKLLQGVVLIQRTWVWILLLWLWYLLMQGLAPIKRKRVWILLSGLGRWFHKLGNYVFSWLLNVLAGYGYKPWRSLFTYLLTIFVFAICYYVFGQDVRPHLSFLAALVLSMTSFHGRGFFPGENVALDSPLTVLAAIEAAIGLIVELSFIAAFTQRFYGK